VGIFAVMAFNAYLRLRSQTAFFEVDSERDLRAAARAPASGVAAVVQADGEARGRDFVERVNLLREEIDLRWLWLDELGAPDAPPDLSPAHLAALRAGDEVTFVRETEQSARRLMYFPLV